MSRRRITRGGIVAAALAMTVAIAIAVVVSQAQGQQEVESRFQLRADIASRFAATYAADLLSREQRAAAAELGGTPPSAIAFESLNEAFGFPASVLLDSRGDALDIWPSSPAQIGANLASHYAHLASALAGHPTVSNEVLSAARHLPVVAFAVPFRTPAGERVYSGAVQLSATALANYLANAIPIPGHHAYVVDAQGNVVASNPQLTETAIHPLATVDAALQRAASSGVQGPYTDSGVASYFAVRSVAGTPWRILVAVPQASLFDSLSGAVFWAPWGAFTLFLLALGGGVVALFRYFDRRSELVAMTQQLEHVARIDSLTGLHNRRHLDEQLDAAISASRRRQESLALLLIDVDRFKRVNDVHGHDAGDRVLQEVARRMALCRRAEDVLGRWGGEEFLVIMENTTAGAARIAAERFRTSVGDRSVDSGKGSITVSISIGVVASVGGERGALLRDADEALYTAKAQGRDRVVLAGEGEAEARERVAETAGAAV